MSCCCGYAPLLALGRQSKSRKYTVPGLKDSGFGRRMTEQAEPEDTSDYSICGQAWQDSEHDVSIIATSIRQLGEQQLLDTFNAQRNKRYGQYGIDFCEEAKYIQVIGELRSRNLPVEDATSLKSAIVEGLADVWNIASSYVQAG